MTYKTQIQIREKLLSVFLEIWEIPSREETPVLQIDVDYCEFNGDEYEITDAERGEIYRFAINDDKLQQEIMEKWVGV